MIRRNFFHLGLVGLLSLLPPRLVSAFPMSGVVGLDDVRLVAYLDDIFRDLEAPRAVGQRYLEICPHEADRCRLSNSILGTEFPQDFNAFRQILQVRRSEDFQVGDFVIIDGWILSRTEARLCALTRLL